MAITLSPGEEAQLGQTIEMFEVITQSQPQDYQSLEILKEAYSKLNREKDVVGTSKRIAQAYVQLGQLSSAILEYETILQRFPDDPDVQTSLKEIETRANSFAAGPEPASLKAQSDTIRIRKTATGKGAPGETFDDGRPTMQKVFVDTKLISVADFETNWVSPDLALPSTGVVTPFIQVIAEKGLLPVDRSLKLISDRSRLGFLPLEKYEIDIELMRKFPAELCQRWCLMPFDRMSKSILVATANPFNQIAARELAAATTSRVLWYLAPPAEIIKTLRKVFR